MSYKLALLASFLLLFIGLIILGAVGFIPDSELTEGHRTLLATGDWMTKSSVGGILGLIGGKGLSS